MSDPAPNRSALVAVVVVNWNGGELLRRCLNSVWRHPPEFAYEVVVVDNASTDGSLEWLREISATARQHLRVLANETNRGFGAANNQAFAATVAPLVFLLNADAELRPGALDALVHTAMRDSQVGACAPRVFDAHGALQPNVARNPATPWEILLSGLRLESLLPRRVRASVLFREHWSHDEPRLVPFASCTALLAKRAMVEDAGGFDERFHMYAEDVEWALRMRRRGWLIAFEPAAQVMHHGHAFAHARWSAAEKQRLGLEAELLGWEVSLGRVHGILNSLASCVVLVLALVRRRARGVPAQDLRTLLGLHISFIARRAMGRRPSGGAPYARAAS